MDYLPYNSIARHRNLNVSNLASAGAGTIFLDMPGLYLITGGWKTVVQNYANINFTAIILNDELNRKMQSAMVHQTMLSHS